MTSHDVCQRRNNSGLSGLKKLFRKQSEGRSQTISKAQVIKWKQATMTLVFEVFRYTVVTVAGLQKSSEPGRRLNVCQAFII